MARMMEIDCKEFDDLHRFIVEYEGNAGNAINAVLKEEGSTLFIDEIKRIMPVSTQRKKSPHASESDSLKAEYIPEEIAIVIKSKTEFNYLYFPDDGSNTVHHVGNQQFFARGVEAMTDEVVDRIIGRLTEKFSM